MAYALGTNVITDSWIMKKRITENFSKSIKFLRIQKREKKGKERALRNFRQKPIWIKMEGKREKENKNSLY